METNNIDINIKKKFQNRTFSPSNSAWERLAVQLDEQPKTNQKGWLFYAGIAASILLLITVGFGLFSTNENQFQPKNQVVISPVDTVLMDSKFNEITNKINAKEAVVEINESKETEKSIPQQKETNVLNEKTRTKAATNNQKVIVAVIDIEEELKPVPSIKTESKVVIKPSIKVDASDLLFAVTHSQKEIDTYYAKNNIDRKKLLQAIENQLQESNVNVNANSILAEVEQNINEDTFKSNFLKMIKKKVSDVATAVAARNN